MAVLFVKLCELVQVVVTNAITAFNRVEFLSARAKVETLEDRVSIYHFPGLSNIRKAEHTSVLIARVGFQLSGGIILQIPYLLPSGPILRMYSIGSRNSSSVGRNVGASEIPNKRSFFGSSLG